MHVLRFPRSDDEAAFVLVQITQKGSNPLDLKLVGTEGEEPYVASLKHDKVMSLCVNNCPVSESEWQKILERLFQQEPLPDIQATATVQSEKSVSITLRKEVQGITQRLGAITLSHDPDEAIELFEWCGAAVESSAGSKKAAADLAVRSSEAETAVTQLQSQLEDLIKAKCEDETILLRRFRDLLNEKKIRIREQQQALAALATKSSMASQSQLSQAVEVEVKQPKAKAKKQTRQAAKSRPAKRKAPATRRVEESEDDVDVDTMDIDIKKEPEDTDPGNTTEATASVDSDDDEGDADASSGAHLKPSQQVCGSASIAASQQKAPSKTAEKPPPPRALPFTTKKTTPKPADDETESDDEL
ncbi:hypothetical protein FVEN_g7348 [Fusarium venenatum]|uniref:Mitotic apparatus protein p62 n=1 Tax=Fusarium venenatum TaxID=56646 RepID=A0A2L2TTL8_9HYPO|nr:uncharacterized protein FVRRES_09858 [Fusarium venenatum]KAG8354842.1 hypothetical protein FVEN_g7348 [Fusarium venenatum]KAH6966508.1 hypothetical protein EDB82DRAFT_334532 [Fusarium venenatum]CEI69781.1 unnamed protein product [Fusarium venenatum]